ncbi:18588_t:CDS:2 [Dentiscutata erythropus]|uniref:18588_t:CDS:1 n=1 Tax=Dentiscutata erythropus TaxID=1348616 RepID=A0A9N9GQV0_9GLOM|nr:18588_t:CDS:2 [Dentiscutata erythropus]
MNFVLRTLQIPQSYFTKLFMPRKRVVVLGAGVSGLTTATLLLQQEKKFEVTVVAKHFPGDFTSEFTSPWAGAHWRSYATNDDIRQQEFEKETFHYFWNHAKVTENEAGVMIVDGFDYWEQLPEDFSEPWFKTFCPDVIKFKSDLGAQSHPQFVKQRTRFSSQSTISIKILC